VSWSPNETGLQASAGADASHRAAALDAEAQQTKDNIEVEVTRDYQNVHQADVSVDAAQRELASAEEAHRVAKELFDNGRGDVERAHGCRDRADAGAAGRLERTREREGVRVQLEHASDGTLAGLISALRAGPARALTSQTRARHAQSSVISVRATSRKPACREELGYRGCLPAPTSTERSAGGEEVAPRERHGEADEPVRPPSSARCARSFERRGQPRDIPVGMYGGFDMMRSKRPYGGGALVEVAFVKLTLYAPSLSALPRRRSGAWSRSVACTLLSAVRAPGSRQHSPSRQRSSTRAPRHRRATRAPRPRASRCRRGHEHAARRHETSDHRSPLPEQVGDGPHGQRPASRARENVRARG